MILKAIAILDNSGRGRDVCRVYGAGTFYAIISLILNVFGLGALLRPEALAQYGPAIAGGGTVIGALASNIQNLNSIINNRRGCTRLANMLY